MLVTLIGVTLIFNDSCARDQADTTETVYELIKLFDFPDELEENSGIIVYDSLIWSFNDSGNEPLLYGISLVTGSIAKRIRVTDANNIDWEDIAQNEQFMFIGDFGNNDGSRQNLKIYILPKNEIDSVAYQELSAEAINFSYNDQVDFTPSMYASKFDCEAMVYANDSLYLFTKDWVNMMTHVYSLPAAGGTYSARHIEDYNSEGLISGGTITNENKLILCGYNLFSPFVIEFAVFGNYSEGITRINLDELSGVQVEGIAEDKNDRYYISNENSIKKQALYQVRIIH